MTREFVILLSILLLTGGVTAVIVASHGNHGRVSTFTDVEYKVCSELRNKALRHFREREFFESENHLRRLLKIEPDNLEMQLFYGRILLETGRTDEAERVFRRMTSANPLNSAARSNLGAALLLRHQYETALRELQYANRNEVSREYVAENIRTAMRAMELNRRAESFTITVNPSFIHRSNIGVVTVSLTETGRQQ